MHRMILTDNSVMDSMYHLMSMLSMSLCCYSNRNCTEIINTQHTVRTAYVHFDWYVVTGHDGDHTPLLIFDPQSLISHVDSVLHVPDD